MANVRVYTIQFLTDNPLASSGQQFTGDRFDFFYDLSLDPTPTNLDPTGITVQYNNGPFITGSPDLLDINFPGLQETFGQVVCDGTTQIIFARMSMSFPWVQKALIHNSTSCDITQPPCDLIFIGEPSVVKCSAPGVDDGSIAVTSFSSRTTLFKLGEDFTYNDGTGQSSGLFSSLFPGTYRIYARDQSNCGANILVTVGIDNSYGALHRLEYYVHVSGVQVRRTKIEIQQRAYSGSVTEYCAGEVPLELSLRGEGQENKFMPLISMNANLTIISESNFQYVHLFTSDRNKYRVVHFIDEEGSGYETNLTLNVVPQTYKEPYLAHPYTLTLTAHCGLADLRNMIYAQGDGLKYDGSVKVISLIADCLKKTGIELNIRVACNIYAEGMNTTDSDDPLDQAYVDVSRFYLFDEAPTILFVLTSLIESFDARLIQWGNRWNIVRVEELNASYDWREFDSNGVYVSEGTTNPVVDRVVPTGSGVHFINQDQNLEILNGFGKVRIHYDLGLLKNVLRNGDFSLKSEYNGLYDRYFFKINTDGFTIVNPDYSIQSSYERIDDDNVALTITGDDDTDGSAYVQSAGYTVKMGAGNTLAIRIRYKIPSPIVSMPYVKLRVMVQYGSYYLASSGAWTTEENIITFYVTEVDKYVESEVIAVQPEGGAINGYDLTVKVFHAWCYHFEYEGTTALKARVTTNLPQGLRTEVHVNAGTYYTGESILYYELEENTDAESLPEIARPDDYHAVSNPVQWIMKKRIFPETLIVLSSDPLQVSTVSKSFSIDKISVNFLYNGNDVTDVISLDKAGQKNNNDVFERTVNFGSLVETVITNPGFGLRIGLFQPTLTTTINLVNQSVLAAGLVYTGYFRDADGNGYVLWTRDGFSESKLLHHIQLASMAAQYGQSVKRLTGSFISSQFIGPLHTIREVLDNNTLYIPMGMVINDRENSFTGEYMQLNQASTAGSSPFSSAFTFGFGDSGFN